MQVLPPVQLSAVGAAFRTGRRELSPVLTKSKAVSRITTIPDPMLEEIADRLARL